MHMERDEMFPMELSDEVLKSMEVGMAFKDYVRNTHRAISP